MLAMMSSESLLASLPLACHWVMAAESNPSTGLLVSRTSPASTSAMWL